MLRPENAATTIQSAFRGHFTRKDLQKKQQKATELAAAIKIQVGTVFSTNVTLCHVSQHLVPSDQHQVILKSISDLRICFRLWLETGLTPADTES